MNTQANTKDSIIFQRTKSFRLASIAKAFSGALKRTFDIIVSLFGLLLLFPIFVLIARWVKQDTPGPAFYRGPRIGRNGRIFRMLKFRTMFEKTESYSGPRLTIKGDARITPLGGWLRDTKINELPQLWNVLTGDMSLVGPRPEDPEIAKTWPEEARSKILSVRPGITSPASILYHDEEKLLSQKGGMNEFYESILPEKIRLDLLYVSHHSFFSDLDTIFSTLFILIPRWAKLSIPEAHFFAGPFARIGHRYFSWFLVDLLTSLAVIGSCAVLWRAQFPLNWGVSSLLVFGVTLALLFSSVNSVVGLNKIDWVHPSAEDGIGLVLSSAFVTGLIMVLNYFEARYRWLGPPRLPTLMIVVIGLMSGASFIFTRYRIRLVSIMANWWLSLRRNTVTLGERLLVVGDGEAGRLATWLLSRPKFRSAYSVVGVINDSDPTKNGMRINGYWMLGGIKDIPAIIQRRDVGAILSTAPAADRETTEYIFDLCQKNNIKLIFLNDLLMMVDPKENRLLGNFGYPAWLEERLAFKAMYDANTGLPNRYLFQDRIKHSISFARVNNSRLAVIFIDISWKNGEVDGLNREIDDRQIILEVKNRLGKCVKEGDTLAYIGKNKFAILLENVMDDGVPDSVTQSLLGLFAEPIKVDQAEVSVHPDFNIKVSMDSDGCDEIEAFCQANISDWYFTKNNTEVLERYGALGK